MAVARIWQHFFSAYKMFCSGMFTYCLWIKSTVIWQLWTDFHTVQIKFRQLTVFLTCWKALPNTSNPFFIFAILLITMTKMAYKYWYGIDSFKTFSSGLSLIYINTIVFPQNEIKGKKWQNSLPKCEQCSYHHDGLYDLMVKHKK